MHVSTIFALGAFCCASVAQAQTAPAPRAATAQDGATTEARVAQLLASMTRAEKLRIVHGSYPNMMETRPDGVPLSAGYVPGMPRLGIPALRETDASLGVAAAHNPERPATALPSGLAQASGWNPEGVERAGAMIGAEARQIGFNMMLAGGVNLTREPRNGRNFEYLGEDPLLAGVLAGHAVRGIQSNHVAATVKHYALNAQETGRHYLDARMDEAALRESDLLAFERAIAIGSPASIMCAYNQVNGVYACESAPLLTILKTDWGYPGWVMSDWGAVHSTVDAVAAGLDQESGEELDEQVYFGQPLADALDSGAISEPKLDEMVGRILHGMVATGLLDHPVVPGGTPALSEHASVARAVAREGIVLLKNRDGLLPLAAQARRIAIIGGRADRGVLSGGGSSQVIPAGSLRLDPPATAPGWSAGVIYHPSAPLDAIREMAPDADVVFDDGSDPARAAALAASADVAIIFATQWTSEAMDAPLALDGDQDALIARVAAANDRSVVVLETGGPVTMPWLDDVGAALEAWYPGSEGGAAIADILFGVVDPSGRLPITFPRDTGQLPNPELPGATLFPRDGEAPGEQARGHDVHYPEGADVGYRWYAREAKEPLFAFGYGLSYTRFSHDALSVDAATRTVRVRVSNTGTRRGTDVVQIYVTPPGAVARLAGWARVTLDAGQSRMVAVRLDGRAIGEWDGESRGWRLAPGDFEVTVARAAGDRAGPSQTVTLGGRIDEAADAADRAWQVIDGAE